MGRVSTFTGIGAVLLVAVAPAAHAELITIPQSSLTPTTKLYTDTIGGGIGSIVVMTGGGSAPGIGDPSGRNDDGFSGPISFGFTGGTALSFFGNDFTSFFANNNGNMSFIAGNASFIPTGPIGANVPTISVWFGDVDTRNVASGVLHIRQDIADQTILTWEAVGRFSALGDLLNTFQMVVRGPNYPIPVGEGAIGFFWLAMPWEATNSSTTAAVGFGNGAGDGVVLEGSNAPGLNSVVGFHQIWFDPTLEPVPRPPDPPFPVQLAAPSPIAVPDVGPSPLYPSVVNLPPATALGGSAAAMGHVRQATAPVRSVGTAGRVRKVTVTLLGLTHAYPADLDILLEGPGGQTVLLMSDAGGPFPVAGVNLTFDSASPVPLPEAGPLRSGTYRPANYGLIPDTPFPPPAPAGPYGTDLSVFNGTDPAGQWKLYVRDDLSGDFGMFTGGWTLTIAIGPAVPSAQDLDGDGRADIAVFRPGTGEWLVRRSFDGRVLVVPFGSGALGDLPVSADYDGDGITDIAVFRQTTGEWFIQRSSDGQLVVVVFGAPGLGDVPVPGDYDGDGKADLAVYRLTTAEWFIFGSSTGFPGPILLGAPGLGDVPIPADYDGDGKIDLGVFRTTTGEWLIFGSATGFPGPILFGAPGLGDLPVPADYDGDGRADFAVFRRTTGEWFIFGSSTGFPGPVLFGAPALGDLPVPADYDGDGKADLAVYRQSNGDWFVFGSATGFNGAITFGLPALADVPTLRQTPAPSVPQPEVPPPPPTNQVPEEVRPAPPPPPPNCGHSPQDDESLFPPACR